MISLEYSMIILYHFNTRLLKKSVSPFSYIDIMPRLKCEKIAVNPRSPRSYGPHPCVEPGEQRPPQIFTKGIQTAEGWALRKMEIQPLVFSSKLVFWGKINQLDVSLEALNCSNPENDRKVKSC